MAGLFDNIAAPTNDPARLLKAIQQQNSARQAEFIAAAPDKGQRAGREIVSGLSTLAGLGAFGKGLKDKFSPENDPDYKAVKQNAELSAAIQKLEGDPSTAEFAHKAADIAKEMGRDDLALQYREAAGVREKQELATELATKQQTIDTARQQFSALPTAAQEELVAVRPELLTDTLGIDPMQAAEVGKRMEERNQFQREKLKKQLTDIRAATTTKTTNADVNQVKSALTSLLGIDSSSFGFGDNTEEFDAFATPIAVEVQRRMDVAKDKGDRLDRNKVLNEVVEELKTAGALKLSDRFFSDKKAIDDIDPDAFRNVFTLTPEDVIDLTQ